LGEEARGVNFVDFAAGYGLRIDDLIADNRWHRCPTEDKPRRSATAPTSSSTASAGR
jgi:hypothetical protein